MTIPQPPLPPDTTHQEDVTKAGQRKINLVWEYTQASIAVAVVIANMVVGVALALVPGLGDKDFPSVLSNTLFLVVGFYFARTNHSNVGGVGGAKPREYQGR